MKIARQVNRDLLIAKDSVFEECEIVFRIILVVFSVNLCVNPVRFGCAQDYPIAIIHLLGDVLEISDLRNVDVMVQLHIGADQPPMVRQPERKVAPALARFPAAKPAARTKQPGERNQAVVPVMITGNRENMGIGFGRRQG